MTNKEALENLMDNAENGYIDIEEVKFVFAEMQNNSDEDCISRAEALKNLALTNSKDDVYRMINSLSSIQSKSKTDLLDKIRAEIELNRNEWIKGKDAEWHTYDRCLFIIDKHRAESEVKK